MQRLKLGDLHATHVGGDSGPAVLLCHGFGAPGDDLVPLAEAIDPDERYRWFFVEAPIDLRSLGIPGRAWWQIDMMRLQLAMASRQLDAMIRETPPGLAEAREKLEGAIAALEKDHRVARNALVVGGFSQGAMLTTELALHLEPPFAGLAILSGALVSLERWTAAAKSRAAKLQIFQSHGRNDPILPFEGAERLRELLESNGARVAWVAHEGGHEIPLQTLLGLRTFLQQRLG